MLEKEVEYTIIKEHKTWNKINSIKNVYTYM